MRHFGFALVLGCGGVQSPPAKPHAPRPEPLRSPPAPAPSDRGPSTSASDPLSYCRLAVHAIDELAACRKTDGFAGMRENYVDYTKHPPEFSRKSGALCATFLEAMLSDPEASDCPFTFTGRLGELGAFLDAYYADRVKLEPTGHAGADAVLATIAKHRDAVCACPDEPCTHALDKADGSHIKPLPASSPTTARDLGGRLIDDISKCSSDIRWARPKK